MAEPFQHNNRSNENEQNRNVNEQMAENEPDGEELNADEVRNLLPENAENEEEDESFGEENLIEEEDEDEDEDDDEDDSDDEVPEGEHRRGGILDVFANLLLRRWGRLQRDRDAGSMEQPRQITFDPTLPSTHAYLGDDLEEYRGRVFYREGSEMRLPLILLRGIVLMPGETIPFQMSHSVLTSALRAAMAVDRTVGIVTDRMANGEGQGLRGLVGTTAEITSMKLAESDVVAGFMEIKAKAVGRQRFRVRNFRRALDGHLEGEVEILPEFNEVDTLAPIRPDWHMRRKRADKFGCAVYTHHARWLYRLYDADELRQRVLHELRDWPGVVTTSLPSDAATFSYWLASQLPLDSLRKLQLLALDSPVARLRESLDLLSRCSKLCCSNCRAHIADRSHVFSLSTQGPSQAFVNPGGYVHETLTLYRVESGVRLRGRPSTESSWFPGYAWTVIECAQCSRHLGWKFTAVLSSLKPEKFWGLTREALVPTFDESEVEV